MEIIGKPTISKPLFYLAKTCIIVCAVFPFFRGHINTFELNEHLQRILGLTLLLPGSILLVVSLLYLGKSSRVGIPSDKTQLKVKGIYAFSRNPMYLGAFLLCLASCVIVPHWLNFICCGLVISIHHSIIKNEEKFLAERFQEQWIAYKTKVRRYL